MDVDTTNFVTGHLGSVVDKISFQDILDAKERISKFVLKTPLVPFRDIRFENNTAENDLGGEQIYLKLENLQPVGSFKLRGASNAIHSLPVQKLQNGVYTASTGNFAQSLAWSAKRLGISCDVIVPEHAVQAKLKPTSALGAKITRVPFDKWWKILEDHSYPGMVGQFIHPCSDPKVIAGNGTIGLEILDELPDVDRVIVPFGGGGLSCGIALAVKSQRPEVKVFACEVDTAAPLHKALAAGRPTALDAKAGFVDGMGAGNLLEEIWPLAKTLLDGTILVSLQQVAEAVRLLVERNHVVSEGAGAASLAAAMAAPRTSGKTVSVVSGGNLDTHKLIQILQGQIPSA